MMIDIHKTIQRNGNPATLAFLEQALENERNLLKTQGETTDG
jgi:hypothetical protein